MSRRVARVVVSRRTGEVSGHGPGGVTWWHPRRRGVGIDQQLGFRYLTFVVTNLDEVIQRLEAAHVAFPRPKTTIRPGTTIAMVKDPDGNIVEFVERG